MKIIKKINSRSAWVQVDDTTAKLMTWSKDMKDAEMKAEGEKVKQKKDKLKDVQNKIKELKQRYGITNTI